MPKSAKRFSENIMRKTKRRMMPKSVKRFTGHIMRKLLRFS
jgi:hypothetical protein